MENGLIFVWTMFYIGFVTVETVKRENRCMRHYFVTTIKHPSKECDSKVSIGLTQSICYDVLSLLYLFDIFMCVYKGYIFMNIKSIINNGTNYTRCFSHESIFKGLSFNLNLKLTVSQTVGYTSLPL